MHAEHIDICLLSEDAILVSFLEDFLKPLRIKVYKHWSQLPRRFSRVCVPVMVVDDALGAEHLEWPRHVKHMHPYSPVVFLTARYLLQARLDALTHGADLCLTKPFAPEELALYLHKFLERTEQLFVFKSEKLSFGPFVLDIQAEQAYYQGQVFLLTPLIFKLFWLLVSSPNTLISRERIAAALWGPVKATRDLRTVDQYVRQLRKALAQCDTQGIVLKTYHRKGYALNAPESFKINEAS
jgi:DNA-binding response OmpR family regulator